MTFLTGEFWPVKGFTGRTTGKGADFRVEVEWGSSSLQGEEVEIDDRWVECVSTDHPDLKQKIRGFLKWRGAKELQSSSRVSPAQRIQKSY